MQVLLYGQSLSQQLIEPFVEQVFCGSKAGEIVFSSAGLFSSDGTCFCDGKSHLGIKRCFSDYFLVSEDKLVRSSPSSTAAKIVRKFENFWQLSLLPQRVRRISPSFDVFHCQGLFKPSLTEAVYKVFPKEMPLVVSCWGSDVLRQSDLKAVKKQKAILAKAQIITASTPEFREQILAKYGQDLRGKMRLAQFAPSLREVLLLDKDESRRWFGEKYFVPSEKILVGIAHNGHRNNQHLELIKGMRETPKELLAKLHIVFPMSYGGGEGYRKEVSKAAEQLGVDYNIISDFLSNEEVCKLRKALQIFIFAPITDSFSATVSEAIAAGSECILGSWLPYKLRQRAGFLYSEIDDPSQSGRVLKTVVEAHLGDSSRLKVNREISESFFNREKLGQVWKEIYEEAQQLV